MPPITALLHTANDGLRLGRTLETLLPCSEILIVDHHSADETRRIAGKYGARVVTPGTHPPVNHYLELASEDWILCMDPGESITEGLQASLFEWSLLPRQSVAGKISFSFLVREQSGEHWLHLPAPETRLIPRTWSRWRGKVPANDATATTLEGELLRFDLP